MIKLISTKDFRGHTRTFEFGPALNELVGPNESGKSTINEAISFVLYGYDSNGTKNPDHLISIGADSTEVAISTDKATFTRRKKRGATSKIVLSREGVPDTELKNMDDVVRLLGSDFDTFASSYNAGYFMRLDPSKRLEVVNNIIKIDRKALFSELGGVLVSLPAHVKLEDPRKEAGYLAQDRRKVQNQLEGHNGRIAQLTQERSILSGNDINIDITNKEIERFEACIALLTAYESASSKYASALDSVRKLDQENKRTADERERISLELKAMPAARDVASIQGDMNGIGDQITALRTQKRTQPAAPKPVTAPDAGVSCSTCGQMVSDKAAKSVVDAYDKTVIAYNTECRAILDFNKNLDEKIALLSKQHSDLLTAMQTEIAASGKRATLEGRLSGLTVKVVDPAIWELSTKPPTVPTIGHSKAEYEKQITSLKAKVLSANGSAGRVKQIDEQGIALDQEAQKMSDSIELFSKAETVLIKLPEEEAARKLQSLSIPGYVVAVVEGILQVSDTHMCPYYSLSSGRKMKFDIEMCKKIQSFLPRRCSWYFIDNEDLIDNVDPCLPSNAQVFVARVDASVATLQIRKH